MKKRKIALILVILALLIAVAFVIAVIHDKLTEELVYSESLDLVAVTVEGEDLTLRDLAFYVAYEEKVVQEQALIYDAEHPLRYWNIHTNGEFMRVTARKAAVDMMVHDNVYGKEAMEAGYSLSEEELAVCDATASDFWSDLTAAQQSALGISEETVYDTCRNIGLVEKYLADLSRKEGRDLPLYETGGKLWEEKRDSMDITYHDRVLNRIEMGSITVNMDEGEE